MSSPSATFVLSTGRCGTQWMAAMLDAVYSDRLHATHEPIDDGYRPRRMLGTQTPLALPEDVREQMLRHLQYVEVTLAHRPYVEVGFPCWSSIPYLAERFSGRMRVIHLVRDPLATALSWTARGAYVPPFLPHETPKILLHPTDDGVAFPDYAARWETLSPFEKNLYFWAEVNHFALRTESELEVPWLRLTAESLFQGDGLAHLLAFLDLPLGNAADAFRDERVDRFPRGLTPGIDLDSIADHPDVLQVADALGYDPLAQGTAPGKGGSLHSPSGGR